MKNQFKKSVLFVLSIVICVLTISEVSATETTTDLNHLSLIINLEADNDLTETVIFSSDLMQILERDRDRDHRKKVKRKRARRGKKRAHKRARIHKKRDKNRHCRAGNRDRRERNNNRHERNQNRENNRAEK